MASSGDHSSSSSRWASANTSREKISSSYRQQRDAEADRGGQSDIRGTWRHGSSRGRLKPGSDNPYRKHHRAFDNSRKYIQSNDDEDLEAKANRNARFNDTSQNTHKDDPKTQNNQEISLNELRLLDSPSRGHTTGLRSLSEHHVQEKYREFVEEKIQKVLQEWPNCLNSPPDPLPSLLKEKLDFILLDFRKLREGLLSSGREDDFTIETYETSARIAIISKNNAQITTIFPTLVFNLNDLKVQRELPNIADLNLDEERLSNDSPISRDSIYDTRALYASLWLLHLVCTMDQPKQFCRDLTRITTCGKDPMTSLIRACPISLKHPHLSLSLSIFEAIISNNYLALQRTLLSAPHIHYLQLQIITSNFDKFRDRIWSKLSKAYLSIQDGTFLSEMLLFTDPSDSEEIKKRKLDEFVTLKGFKMNSEGVMFKSIAPRRS